MQYTTLSTCVKSMIPNENASTLRLFLELMFAETKAVAQALLFDMVDHMSKVDNSDSHEAWLGIISRRMEF